MNRESRDISFPEEYCFWRTQLKTYTNYKILVEYSHDITQEALYHALTRMLYRYSALTTNVMPTNTNKIGFNFVLVDTVQFGDVVEFIEDENLENPEKILDSTYDTYFTYGNNKPLWKLQIINKKFILFYCDHIIYDGTSGKNFHIELSKELCISAPSITSNSYHGLDSILFQKSMIDFDSYQLIPSPPQIIDYNGSFGLTLYKLLVALTPETFSKWLKRWLDGNPYSKMMNYDTITYKECKLVPNEKSTCRIIHLTQNQLNSLLKVARAHQIKLTSLIIMLGNLSCAKYITGKDNDIVVGVPVNMRPLIQEETANKLCNNFSSLFGLYVGVLFVDLPAMSKLCPDGNINWDLVKYVNGYIHDNFKTAPVDYGLLRFTDIKQYIVETHEKNEKYAFEISNLGMIPSENSNIVNAWFDQPTQIFSVNMISTANGANLALRCCNEEWIDGYKDEFEKRLFALAANPV